MDRPNIQLLEQKCSKMILDCVDWKQLDGTDTTKAIQDVGNAYDVLY